jgi:hypothetical protein
MQDNNGKYDKWEKGNKNKTNPRNHHLEFAAKPLGITTKQRRESHLKSSKFSLFIKFLEYEYKLYFI